MREGTHYRGRLAPSPSGLLHLGVARTALITWLCARQAGGRLLFRLEDLDGPRTLPGAAESIAEDLRFLGLDWDEGFLASGTVGPYSQSQRSERYLDALDQLQRRGLLFACTCSRREVAEASRAPHGDLGPTYPGTCKSGRLSHPARAAVQRFAMPDRPEPFEDGVLGWSDVDTRDDFVVRRADGIFGYQLAVVVDDAAMGITEVVRGADLQASTHRQLALYRALDLTPPRFAHVPLMLGPDGRRLSKRLASVGVRELAAAGADARQLIGALGASVGLCPVGERCEPADLLPGFSLADLPKGPTTFDPARLGLPEW